MFSFYFLLSFPSNFIIYISQVSLLSIFSLFSYSFSYHATFRPNATSDPKEEKLQSRHKHKELQLGVGNLEIICLIRVWNNQEKQLMVFSAFFFVEMFISTNIQMSTKSDRIQKFEIQPQNSQWCQTIYQGYYAGHNYHHRRVVSFVTSTRWEWVWLVFSLW